MAVKNGVFYQHTTDDNLIGANPQNGVRYVSANGYAPGGSSLNAGNPQVGDAYLKVLDQQASAPAAAAGTQSSFADSGSMKAISAPTNAVYWNPTADNTPTNLIGDPNKPQTITPYGNGATPTYSDYMGVQYTTSRPGDFQYDNAPTFTDPYDPAGKSQAYYDALNNPFTYTKPENYTSRLQGTWDAQLAAAQAAANRQFTYDASTDPVYQAYLKQYAREGQRASANTLGQAAAMTGGRPSSYAVSAASQAGNYYAAQAADKLPELYQQAYQRYLQDYQNKLGLLSAINQRENTEQGIWEGNTNNTWKGISTDLGIYNDRIQNAYNAAALERSLSNDAFNQYQTALDQYNKDKNFAYGQNTDDINWEAGNESTTYNRAEAADQKDWERNTVYADERADIEYNRKLNFALQMAQMGDLSYLEELGVDTDYYRQLLEAQLADQRAQTAARLMKGSGASGSKSSGSGLTIDDTLPIDEEGETGEETTQQANYPNARVQKIINDALTMGLVVRNPADWEYLKNFYTEKELSDLGLRPMGQGTSSAAAIKAGNNITLNRGNQTITSGANDGSGTALNGKTNKSKGKTAAVSSTVNHGGASGSFPERITDYDDAADRMSAAKVPQTYIDGLLTEEEWTKKKKAASVTMKKGNRTIMNDDIGGDLSYASYADYVNAYANWALDNYGR